MRLNSFDEWSPLKEIIVGSAQNYTSHERELSFELFFHENIVNDNVVRTEWYYPHLSLSGQNTAIEDRRTHSAIKQRYIEELIEDIDGLVKTLESLSVQVKRPIDLQKETNEVRTLPWSASVVPPLNIRDITLILGDEIIETSPMIRSRFFETQFLKPIFMNYFRQGARWTVMPRPLMTDASFDPSYADHTAGGPMQVIHDPQPSPYDVGYEIMLDGAQCVRLGRDLIVNIANANHAMGCDWLENHLGDRFRVHRVYRLSDSHIDSMLLALRPGTLLVRSKKVAEFLPEPLKKWDLIVPPMPSANNFPHYDDDDLVLASPYIDLNVLSVSPDTVIVNDACPELMRTLEQARFTVVPVRHRHRRLFGGGFHCFTLDTVRDGKLEDYFS
jgi:glycine amidinotransferase